MADFRYKVRLYILLMLWIGLIVYAAAFSSPAQPNTLELIQSLALGQWSGINPFIVALFNVMAPLIGPALYLAIRPPLLKKILEER